MNTKHVTPLVILLFSGISGYAMESVPKKEKKESLVAQIVSSHLFTQNKNTKKEITELIDQYCDAPYFFAQYIHDKHEQNGEDITQTSISPNGRYIGTFGYNSKYNTHSIHIHETLRGLSQGSIPHSTIENRPPQDIAWNRSSGKAIVTFGDTWTVNVGIDNHKSLLCTYSPTNVVDAAGNEYYCLRNYYSDALTAPIGPGIARICHDAKGNNEINPISLTGKSDRPLYVDNVAFVRDHNHLVTFQSDTQVVNVIYKEGAKTINKRTNLGVTFVDFSVPNPVFGAANGTINIINQKDFSVFSSIKAFDIPVELIAAYPNAIVAIANKAGKVFNIVKGKIDTQVGAFKHTEPCHPSQVVLSPDRSLVAYAAYRTLYIKSTHNGEEKNRHLFEHRISSLNRDSEGNIFLTQGGQVIKLLKDTPHA